MKHRHLLALLQEGYTTIEVVFTDDASVKDGRASMALKRYTYKARLADNVQVGNRVVVDSPSNGLTVVTVVAVHSTPKIDLDVSWTYKWIVQKIDTAAYEETLRKEEHFAEVMLEVERARQRALLVEQFRTNLPENSEARKLFDNATRELLDGNVALETPCGGDCGAA